MMGPGLRFNHHTPKARRAAPFPAGAADGKSNLERFLESTTPSVPALPPAKGDDPSHFLLADVWEAYGEWSVYGAGVPLRLHDRERVVQYYVPYLSAIQIYCEEARRPGSASLNRRAADESDLDSSRDSSSDSSSDSELERVFGGLYLNKYTSLSDGFSSDDGEAGCNLGHRLFEFFERDVPYSRVPLTDKISSLASHFPQLKTLRSSELLPSSWMSIAWYPIYRIPTGATLRDLECCFLTFHSLSTPLGGIGSIPSRIITHPPECDGFPNITLPIFALASYKFKSSIWTPRGGCQRQLVSSLLQSADNWLRLLRVNHPDYQFFLSRGAFHR